MNSLSMLIYLVGVVDSINTLALWMIIPGMIGCLAVTIIWLIMNGVQFDNLTGKEETLRQIDFAWKWWTKGKNIAVTVCLIGWLMFIFIPTRQTLILVAGSEIGGKVAQSSAVQSVVDPGLDLVKSWIAAETAKLQPKKDKDK